MCVLAREQLREMSGACEFLGIKKKKRKSNIQKALLEIFLCVGVWSVPKKRRRGEKERRDDVGHLSQVCVLAPPPWVSAFQTIRQDSWPSDITSCWSCNHQVTYAKPACTAAVTDTRTAGTYALHKRPLLPRSEDQNQMKPRKE